MTRSAALGDVARVIAGQHIQADLYSDRPPGEPYLTGPADFTERYPIISRWTSVPKVFAENGDVLLTVKGAGVGKSNLGCHAAIGRQLMAIRPIARQLDQIYLLFFLREKEREIAALAQGATVPGIAKPDIEAFRIPVPSLDEQRRIAAILDQADDVRRKRRAALERLDRLATVTFSDLFGDPLYNNKGWPSGSPLGELAAIVSGVTKGRKLNGVVGRSVPYLAVANVQDRALRLATVKSIEATEDEIDRYRLLPGDLLLTEGGDPDKLGRGTLWQGEMPECIHQNHIFRVRLCSGRVQPLFLNWLVASERGKRYFLQSAKQTTGIASINMGQLRSFPMLLPPIDLQHAFAARVAEIDKLRASHRAHLAHLDALFAALQHRAFRGEL